MTSPSASHNYQPVFLIVTAANCAACIRFKDKEYAPFMKIFSESPESQQVQYINIPLPSLSSPIPADYPSSLKKVIHAFPSILLIEGESWKKDADLRYVSYYDDPQNTNKPLTATRLMLWLRKYLRMPPFHPNIILTKGGKPVKTLGDVYGTKEGAIKVFSP